MYLKINSLRKYLLHYFLSDSLSNFKNREISDSNAFAIPPYWKQYTN